MPSFHGYHERQADRLRSLAASATTPPVKARLIEEAEQHERLALLDVLQKTRTNAADSD
jgi:hypothetical protein